MSATTFFLILAAVIAVLLGFVAKSWSELSSASRSKPSDKNKDQDKEPS